MLRLHQDAGLVRNVALYKPQADVEQALVKGTWIERQIDPLRPFSPYSGRQCDRLLSHAALLGLRTIPHRFMSRSCSYSSRPPIPRRARFGHVTVQAGRAVIPPDGPTLAYATLTASTRMRAALSSPRGLALGVSRTAQPSLGRRHATVAGQLRRASAHRRVDLRSNGMFSPRCPCRPLVL